MKLATMTNAELDEQLLEHDAAAGRRVAAEVERLLARFISYPSEHSRKAHVLWILHTHALRHFDFTPRLAFLSPEPASGKTRALEITARLVPNPVETVNCTPAYLFRRIGTGDVTILYDEIDTIFGPRAKENEEIRGLINAGHHKGAMVGRCVIKGKVIETEDTPAFAPIALAGLGWLPDTIRTRAVIVQMKRRAAGEVVEPYRRRIHDPETDRILGLIQTWAAGAFAAGVTWPTLPSGIADRDADIWEPLIAIADEIGGDWPAVARDAAVTFVTAGRDIEPSLGIRLLADLQKVFDGRDQMQTADILASLIGIEEAPWGDLKGKPLNPRGLATRLKQYGVKAEVLWFGSRQARGYRASDLKEPWSRYLALPTSAASVTSVPDVTTDVGITAITDITCRQDERGSESHRHKCSHCRTRGLTVQVSRSGFTTWVHKNCITAWEADFDERNADEQIGGAV